MARRREGVDGLQTEQIAALCASMRRGSGPGGVASEGAKSARSSNSGSRPINVSPPIDVEVGVRSSSDRPVTVVLRAIRRCAMARQPD